MIKCSIRPPLRTARPNQLMWSGVRWGCHGNNPTEPLHTWLRVHVQYCSAAIKRSSSTRVLRKTEIPVSVGKASFPFIWLRACERSISHDATLKSAAFPETHPEDEMNAHYFSKCSERSTRPWVKRRRARCFGGSWWDNEGYNAQNLLNLDFLLKFPLPWRSMLSVFQDY